MKKNDQQKRSHCKQDSGPQHDALGEAPNTGIGAEKFTENFSDGCERKNKGYVVLDPCAIPIPDWREPESKYVDGKETDRIKGHIAEENRSLPMQILPEHHDQKWRQKSDRHNVVDVEHDPLDKHGVGMRVPRIANPVQL
ncbi:MAG TPA: hypothetical protein VMU28_12440 [Terriglobales bacterium]|nr:hypothetical protein [Terriglobales bacterium]